MDRTNLVQMIGNLLTKIDTTLSHEGPGRLDPEWKKLYELRNQLDEKQRKLVEPPPNLNADDYRKFVEILSKAYDQLAAGMNDPSVNVTWLAEETSSAIEGALGYVEPPIRDT